MGWATEEIVRSRTRKTHFSVGVGGVLAAILAEMKIFFIFPPLGFEGNMKRENPKPYAYCAY